MRSIECEKHCCWFNLDYCPHCYIESWQDAHAKIRARLDAANFHFKETEEEWTQAFKKLGDQAIVAESANALLRKEVEKLREALKKAMAHFAAISRVSEPIRPNGESELCSLIDEIETQGLLGLGVIEAALSQVKPEPHTGECAAQDGYCICPDEPAPNDVV